MHERRFSGAIERLRAPERVALLEIDRVVTACLEGAAASTVLDVGTGSGVFAEAFAARGLAVTGIDPNPAMLEAARGFVPSASFVPGTLESIPFEDGSFDLVFLGHVLHEADHPRLALSESRRCARMRVAVLEWPYRIEEQGPPIDHRLRPETVLEAASAAGFRVMSHARFRHMDFYVFER